MNEDIIKKQKPLVENPNSDVLYQDVCTIIDQAQVSAYRAVNETLIKRNWLLGMRINMDVIKVQRAEYGEQIVKSLAKALTNRYGEGFTKNNLYNYIGFYKTWPEFFHAVSGKSENIVQSLIAQSPIRLSWTHYRIILQDLLSLTGRNIFLKHRIGL